MAHTASSNAAKTRSTAAWMSMTRGGGDIFHRGRLYAPDLNVLFLDFHIGRNLFHTVRRYGGRPV